VSNGKTGFVPAFAVKTDDGRFLVYDNGRKGPDGRLQVSDNDLQADLSPTSENVWTLNLTAKGRSLREIWFPIEPSAEPLGDSLADDVVHFPHLMGLAFDVDALSETDWQGREYPGPCFAPLAFIADPHEVRMVAAVNWPPRKVRVLYAKGRLALCYDDPLPTGASRAFSAMIVRSMGDPSAGELPWYAPLDHYRDWLTDHMRAEGLYPIPYPDWMKTIHGWQNVQLENFQTRDLDRVAENWRRFKKEFPWLQMWGQMSEFHTTPGVKTGCCLDDPTVHSRYTATLPALIKSVTEENSRAGFYVRPKSPYGLLDKDVAASKPDRDFLFGWIKQNELDHKVNAHYVDVLGAKNFGAPLTIARMFGHEIPRESVIERIVDVYPAAALISGCLWGGLECRTAPGKTPEHLGKDASCLTFPRFGRYLLNDRIVFLGESNGDHMYWGTTRGHDYFTERQVFLLGAKFDAMRLSESERTPNEMNRAVRMVLDERNRVDWWNRDPVYMDRRGLTEIPPDIDVRRFRGKGNVDLLVIDNWKLATGRRFLFEGAPVAVPPKRLHIEVRGR